VPKRKRPRARAKSQRRLEPLAEWLKRADIAATLEARDRVIGLDSIVKELPEPWRGAARLVDPLGVQANLVVALAFCDWWQSGERSRTISSSFLTSRSVMQYRKRVVELMGSFPARGRGRPSRPGLSAEELATLKARYQLRLAEYRRAHGPAGDLVRRRLLKEVAVAVDYRNRKALADQMFRKEIHPQL
jgi:hypothetical protein